ncbi:hypothetical protein HJ01_02523 [Flavobacterium frigoris PS1]|uniref:Uncharacterized protein n=1 Tax=Flavobacterium frigoris (strain PS1) TaxID=1086011 RepID=H7FSF8_FLAFP|nr:hypothetical protein HJ01_02523 [Flavobacterium frigoris PS1]
MIESNFEEGVMKINSCGLAPMGACILFVLGFSTKDTVESGREVHEKMITFAPEKSNKKKHQLFGWCFLTTKKTINIYSTNSV